MEWNEMEWNEESCTLGDKAFTHYSIIGEDRCRDDASLSSSRFSPQIYLKCFVRCADLKEIHLFSRNMRGNTGNRNRNVPEPPSFPSF